MSPRHEHLRAYVLAVIADGELQGVASTPAALRKLATVFYADAGKVLTELADTAAATVGDRLTAKGVALFGELLGGLQKRGAKAVWGDLQSAYRRGVEEKSKK